MNVGSVNYLRRFLVNGILGAAVMVPFWLIVTGTYIVGADQVTIFDWKAVNWVWVGIVALCGASAFQYVSIRYARARSWQSIMLVGVSAWGGAICALAAVDLFFLFLDKAVAPSFISFITIGLAGCTLGVALWTRVNAVKLRHLLQEPPGR